MFKRIASEALGISDIGVIVAPADYDKVAAESISKKNVSKHSKIFTRC